MNRMIRKRFLVKSCGTGLVNWDANQAAIKKCADRFAKKHNMKYDLDDMRCGHAGLKYEAYITFTKIA